MRHRVAHRKLGRVTSHRLATLRSLATALFERERIRTTLMKAKDPVIVRKLFDDLGARFSARPGGYTRILRLGPRRGDGAEMAIVELLGSEFKPEKKDEKGKKTEAEKKPEGKAGGGKPAGGRGKAKAAKGEKAPEGGEKKKTPAKAKGKKKAAAKEAE